MKLIFFTTNHEKLAEAQLALAPFNIKVEGRSFPFIEPTKGSLEDIALFKLSQIQNEENPFMVDDSGIFFEAYPGFPGILTKRTFKMVGYKGIRKLLDGETRRSFFQGVIALKWNNEVKTFTGETSGQIIPNIPTTLPNELKFPFDPIFVPDGDNRVLSDMTLEQRVYYSYRRKALEGLVDWFAKQSIKQ